MYYAIMDSDGLCVDLKYDLKLKRAVITSELEFVNLFKLKDSALYTMNNINKAIKEDCRVVNGIKLPISVVGITVDYKVHIL